MAKLVVHGADRAEALDRARAAVAAFRVEGPKCNLPFFAELLVHPEFVSGDYDTGHRGPDARLTRLWLDANGRPAGPDRREEPLVAMEVRAEMVANVWKVVVAQGDSVADGDTLVILESMKMEIPVLAEGDGTVSALHVVRGRCRPGGRRHRGDRVGRPPIE